MQGKGQCKEREGREGREGRKKQTTCKPAKDQVFWTAIARHGVGGNNNDDLLVEGLIHLS